MIVDENTKICVGNILIKEVYQGENKIYDNMPYTKLNYIEKSLGGTVSTNKPYIDTGFKPNQDTRIEIKVGNSTHPAYWCGCWNTAYNRGAYCCCNDRNDIYSGYDDQGGGSGTYVDTGEHIINMNKNIVYVDNVLFRTFNYTQFQVNYNLHLFGQNRQGTNSYGDFGSMNQTWKLYYCKIWDNDILIRDFIPVLDENNVPCMYDKVEEKFYYNAGSGQFLYG